jgi:hypothetical protein
MATPFDSFGYNDATQTVARAVALSEIAGISTPSTSGGKVDSSPRPLGVATSAAALRRMIEGDHWLDGAGWIGPRPGPMDEGASDALALIHAAFMSENALADVIDRHVAGVLGREPEFGFTVRRHLKNTDTPTPTEQALIDEAEAAVTEWWDARKVHAIVQGYVRTLLYARRAPARLYVPRGKLAPVNVDDGSGRVRTVKQVPRAADVAEGLSFVWPDAPLPENATVAVDEDTKESIGVVIYTGGQNVQGTNSGTRRAECVYSSGTGKTIIKQLDEGTAGAGAVVPLEFGGRLTMYEMSRSRFITPQMVQIQRGINLTLTALGRNVVTAGWLERIIANAQMPKGWTRDAATGKLVQADGAPTKHTTGGGVTLYLTGQKQVEEATGKTTLATPTVTFREPGQASPLVETLETLYRAMLREAKQEHVLMAQMVASDTSREQARADYQATLRATATEVNALGRWLVETALAMAEAFVGEPGRFTKTLRATFDVSIDTGPITSDERTAIDASVTAGTLAREAAMSAAGVADVDAMIEQMNNDPLNRLELGIKRATMLAQLTTAGADLVGAAILCGFTPKEAAALVPKFADPANPNADPNAPPKPGDPAPGGPPPSDTPPADAGQGTGGNGNNSGGGA